MSGGSAWSIGLLAGVSDTVETATRSGVTLGAHVSYPDRRGFGRYDLKLPPSEVTNDVLYQMGALDAFARAAGTRV